MSTQHAGAFASECDSTRVAHNTPYWLIQRTASSPALKRVNAMSLDCRLAMDAFDNGQRRSLDRSSSEKMPKNRHELQDGVILHPAFHRARQLLDSQSLSRLISWLDSVEGPVRYPQLPHMRSCHSAPSTIKRMANELAGPWYLSCPANKGPPSYVSPGHHRIQIPRSCLPSSSEAPLSASSPDPPTSNLAQDPNYRKRNLRLNGISANGLNPYSGEALPPGLSALVSRARQKRDSPEPSVESVRRDLQLSSMMDGGMEAVVEDVIREHFFPRPAYDGTDPLGRGERIPMAKPYVPSRNFSHEVSTPVPDMIYGYDEAAGAFSDAQAVHLASQDPGHDGVANKSGLLFPFFVVEVKGDSGGGSGSSLYVATNQCLGGSATCISIAERLNQQLRESSRLSGSPVRQTDSAAWSIAIDNSQARLYISWQGEDLVYYTRGVDSFLLQRPEDYLLLRRNIRNILDWGRNERLQDIRGCIDTLVEEARLQASQKAKSRPAPSDASSSRGSTRRRVSESGR